MESPVGATGRGCVNDRLLRENASSSPSSSFFNAQIPPSHVLRLLRLHSSTQKSGRNNIEEIHRVDSRASDENMSTWIQALKIMIKILHGEKRLCYQIFDDESELIKEVCFVEMTSSCVMQLLKFGEVVAIGNRSFEKLFRILDMYDALKNALPELQGLFVDGSDDLYDLVIWMLLFDWGFRLSTDL